MSRASWLKLDTIFASDDGVAGSRSSLRYDYDFTPSGHVYLWISGMKAFTTKLVRLPRKRWNDGGYRSTLDDITYVEVAGGVDGKFQCIYACTVHTQYRARPK